MDGAGGTGYHAGRLAAQMKKPYNFLAEPPKYCKKFGALSIKLLIFLKTSNFLKTSIFKRNA